VRDIGFKGYQLYSLPYFCHKLMQALPPSQTLRSVDIGDAIQSVLRYMTTRDEPQGQTQVSVRQFEIVKAQLDKLENEVALTQSKIE